MTLTGKSQKLVIELTDALFAKGIMQKVVAVAPITMVVGSGRNIFREHDIRGFTNNFCEPFSRRCPVTREA